MPLFWLSGADLREIASPLFLSILVSAHTLLLFLLLIYICCSICLECDCSRLLLNFFLFIQISAQILPPYRPSLTTLRKKPSTPHNWFSPSHFNCRTFKMFQFSLVQSLSHVQLFATPWTAPHQASLSITNSQSLLKLMSIESVMSSNHLLLCHPLLLPSVFPSIRVFSNESALCIRWPKYWRFSFSISPSKNIQDWLPLGWTGWISLQSKGLWRVFSNTTVQKHQFFSTFFIVHLSHSYMTTRKTIALTRWNVYLPVFKSVSNDFSVGPIKTRIFLFISIWGPKWCLIHTTSTVNVYWLNNYSK